MRLQQILIVDYEDSDEPFFDEETDSIQKFIEREAYYWLTDTEGVVRVSLTAKDLDTGEILGFSEVRS